MQCSTTINRDPAPLDCGSVLCCCLLNVRHFRRCCKYKLDLLGEPYGEKSKVTKMLFRKVSSIKVNTNHVKSNLWFHMAATDLTFHGQTKSCFVTLCQPGVFSLILEAAKKIAYLTSIQSVHGSLPHQFDTLHTQISTDKMFAALWTNSRKISIEDHLNNIFGWAWEAMKSSQEQDKTRQVKLK